MKKRILSMICVLALCLGLLPSAAFAADGDTAIMLGTNGISGYDDSTNSYDYIYFGNWEAPDQYTDSGSIKWRVLDDQTNTEEPGLFLLTDRLFGEGNSAGGGVCFDSSSPYSNVWQGSDAQAWCSTFYTSSFSEDEQGAVLATTKTDEAYTAGKPPIPHGTSELKEDEVFFLSAEEAENSAYGFINDAARLAYFGNGNRYGAWWLRSPVEQQSNRPVAGSINRTYGSFFGNYVNTDSYSARPAFNLDLDAVLFTSAAVGGKSASGMESGLTAVDAYDGSEWKLTLLDDSRDFDVTETDISGDPGDTITLHYTGATTGDNEYISVILAAESSVQYYGRIAKATTADAAEGEISLTIPDTLAEGTYTLNVFNEQCNGDYKTDYASAFETFTLTVDITAPTLSNGSATRGSETAATATFTSSEAGTCYYIAQDTEIALTNEQIAAQGRQQTCNAGENEIELDNITASAWYVTVVAQDAVGNISDVLKMEIPAYIAPVYDISADTQSLDFGTVTEGYEAPAEQTVTITNAGNQPQTLTQPASTSSFEVGTLSKAELPVGETVTFTVRPKAGLPVGSYSENIVVSGLGNTTVSVTANFTVKQFSSGGGSSSSGGSGTTTETTKNPDGSTTTTVTNKNTGTVTETTTWPDGSKEVIETKKDGTVTTTTTDADGSKTEVVEEPDGTVTTTTTDTASNKTEVVENTDGSSKTTVDNKDGSGSVTVVDENGNVVSSATLSQSAVEAAQEKGEAVTLPMPEVPVTADRETAPTVTVSLPSGTTAKVEIPVENVTPGTVAILVKADGTEEVIKTSLTTETGVAVILFDGDTVKIVDNNRDFADVPDNYWGAEAVDFATSRELFAGTGASTFSPDTPMTRGMFVTVLARFEGVDTTTGSTWYEAGQQWAMQNGVSDGSNMDASLTREQLATMFYRYAQSKGYDTTQGGMAIREYADFEQISDYAVEAMTWAVNTGLISGTSTTTLSPQGEATRAQVATILMRFIETGI